MAATMGVPVEAAPGQPAVDEDWQWLQQQQQQAAVETAAGNNGNSSSRDSSSSGGSSSQGKGDSEEEAPEMREGGVLRPTVDF